MELIDLTKVIEHNILQSKNVTFVVNSRGSGKHTYTRFDMSEVASRGLLKQFPNWKVGTSDNHQLEFRLDLTNEQAIFCYRVTSASFRFRGYQRMFSKAALRPSIAHALVWLSNPPKDQCFVDPFYGLLEVHQTVKTNFETKRSCDCYNGQGGRISKSSRKI